MLVQIEQLVEAGESAGRNCFDAVVRESAAKLSVRSSEAVWGGKKQRVIPAN